LIATSRLETAQLAGCITLLGEEGGGGVVLSQLVPGVGSGGIGAQFLPLQRDGKGRRNGLSGMGCQL